MALVIAAFAGIIAGLFLHWFSWYTRLNHLSWGVFLGIPGAVGITLLGAIFIWPYPSDIADLVLGWLIRLWAFALLVGYLQARSLPARWWQGVLSVFYEAGLAFLIGVGVNYTLQYTALGLLSSIPVGEILNRFILVFLIVLAALAVIRPLIRLYKSRRDRSLFQKTTGVNQ